MNIHSQFTQYGRTPIHGKARKQFSLRDKLTAMGVNDVAAHLSFVDQLLRSGFRLDVRRYNPHKPPAQVSA